jgi:hypothetical protein
VPIIKLFGIDNLIVGTTQAAEHRLGNFTNTLKLQLAPGNALSVGFDGQHPLGTAAFAVTVPCDVQGDVVSLRASESVGLPASMQITLPFSLGMSSTPPAMFVTASGELAFADGGLLRSGLRNIPIVADLVVLDWGSDQRWSAFGFTFDFTAGAIRYVPRPNGPNRELRIVDVLDGVATREQPLAIDSVLVRPGSVEVRARPHEGMLLLHADVLNAAAVDDAENDLLHQYALVNGQLTIGVSGTTPATRKYAWEAFANPAPRAPAGLLLFRLTNEHGHPLFVEPAAPADPSQSVRLPLHRREGIQVPNDDASAPSQWEQTIAALVVHTGSLPVNVRSIDARTVGTTFQDRERKWLGPDGRVTVAERGPAEIHGLAKGVLLRRADPAETGIFGGTFHTELIEVDQIGHLFTKTDLEIADAGAWRLKSQLEERDAYAGAFDTPPESAEVGYRVAAAPEGVPLKLPAVDTSFALANLTDDRGRIREGAILASAGPWIAERDAQFAGAAPTVFAPPAAQPSTHVSGFAFVPPAASTFRSVLDQPPGRASAVAETARTPAWLDHQEAHYIHGGTRDAAAHDALINALIDSQPRFGVHYENFLTFWNTLQPAPRQAMALKAVRDLMGIAPRRKTLPRAELTAFFDEAKAILHGGRHLAGTGGTGFEAAKALIPADLTRAQFELLWTSTTEPALLALFDLLWAGTGTGVFRRAIEIDRAALADDLKEIVTAAIPPLGSLDAVLAGFPTPVINGLDETVALLMAVWTDPSLDLGEFRRRFGASLTLDVYRLLLTHSADLEEILRRYFLSARFRDDLFQPTLAALLRAIEAAWNHGAALKPLRDQLGEWRNILLAGVPPTGLTDAQRAQLFAAAKGDFARLFSTLRFDPPEYLVFSARFRAPITDAAKAFSARLWNQMFRLADLGEASHWNFVLDAGSTVVVKLTGSRTLDDILTEITASYANGGQSDPLGLGEPMEVYLARLDTIVRDRSWRGVFVIRPTADIRGDKQLRTLTGLAHISMTYAAIGGAKPELAADAVDVYAAIHAERAPLGMDGEPPEDLTLTLVKFDATIRNTRLVAGEVIFSLDIRNLLGRDTRSTAFPPLLLRGTVPRDQKADGNSFEFSAWFEQPVSYRIDIAFIKALVFKALRVSTSRGQTSVDIDADVELQQWNVAAGGLDFTVGPDDEDAGRLVLQNFRILLPSLGKSVSLAMGQMRPLNFELPAVSFNWPKPRPLTLWNGIELLPIGLGFIRRVAEAGDALRELIGRYQWLNSSVPFGNASGQFQFPYLRCQMHFGKLPQFGGTSLARLNLEVIIGLVIEAPGAAPSIAIGLGGLDASEITIDLFGVIKVELERLILDRFECLNAADEAVQRAVAVVVDNPRLTLLGWSLLEPTQKLQFLLAQAERAENGRAVLGFYGDAKPPADRFFRLHWLLVAHNLALSAPRITQYLLGNDTSLNANTAHGLLEHFVDFEARKIHATIVDDDSWLFGASFDLGSIVTPGTIVLHDQHYYGISLRGDAIEALFGVKRLELSYVPGPTREQDRFRASFRLPALDLIGSLRSGDIAIEWGFNWDFLLDFGFPWKSGAAYQWQRAFSLPMGTYEAKFGLYFEKRSQMSAAGTRELVIAAGAGFYVGYYFGFGTPGRFVWAQAGIGVFAILEGSVRLALPQGTGAAGLIKAGIQEVRVRGVIGIYAYGEGGIELWVISARFRVAVQAAIAGELHYLPGAQSTLAYAATLSVAYSASVRVGCGFFSFTFSISGSIEVEVSGQALLN